MESEIITQRFQFTYQFLLPFPTKLNTESIKSILQNKNHLSKDIFQTGESYVLLQCKHIKHLVQSEYFEQESEQTSKFEILGDHFLKCMATNVILFDTPIEKSDKLIIPDISQDILEKIEITVEKKHLLRCLGKTYHEKNIQKINLFQSDIKQLLNLVPMLRKLNISQNSVAKTQNTQNNKFHETLKSQQINKSSFNEFSQTNSQYLSESITNPKTYPRQNLSMFEQKQQRQMDSLNLSSFLDCLNKSQDIPKIQSVAAKQHSGEVDQYLNTIVSFATQISSMSQFKFKDSKIQEQIYEVTLDGQFLCRSVFVIKHYENNNFPETFSGIGKAPQKKKAKEICFRQILKELYSRKRLLFQEWKNQKAKKGIKC